MEFRDFSLLAVDTKVSEFADGLARGVLLATKCTTCGAMHYPPRSDCPECYGGGFEWIPLEGAGRLVTYTSIFVPPEHFAPDLRCTAPLSRYSYRPKPVGLVELENGLRVMGWIDGVAPEAVKVGMMLVPVAEILKDGRATVVLREVGAE